MRRSLAALAVLLVIGSRDGRAQERAGFITLRGTDTLAAESFARTAGNIDGILAVRDPRAAITYYQARLRFDSTIVRLEMLTRFPGQPDSVFEKSEMQFSADSALITQTRDGRERSFMVPVRAAVPWVPASMALYEPMFRRSRRIREDTSKMNLLAFNAPALPASIIRAGDRVFTFRHAGGDTRVDTDEIGRVLSWTRTTGSGVVRGERRPGISVESVAAEFLHAERTIRKDRVP